jgi:predicted membrane-bound spermidine synthase
LALAVIVAVLYGGRWDGDSARALGSCLLLGLFCGASLPGVSLIDKSRVRPLGQLTIGLCALAFLLGVVLIWTSEDDPSDGLIKSAAVSATLALACADVALMITRWRESDSNVVRVLIAVTVTLASVVALMITVMILDENGDDQSFARLLAVIAILWALGTVLTPIVRVAQKATST